MFGGVLPVVTLAKAASTSASSSREARRTVAVIPRDEHSRIVKVVSPEKAGGGAPGGDKRKATQDKENTPPVRSVRVKTERDTRVLIV
jgi:hypothetical protein